MNQSWSIIVFCFNEAATVGNVIDHAAEILARISPDESEIIVVDDGSTDDSFHVIEQERQLHSSLKIIRHDRNKGIGEALLSGYRLARCENVCAVPADGQFDIAELLRTPAMPDGAIISFCRESRDSYSLYRRFLSFANRLVNSMLGVRLKDVNWVKVYKTESLKNLDLRLRSSLVESEICAKLLFLGFRVLECPSIYHKRSSGSSKAATSKSLRRVIFETFKLPYVIARFKMKSYGQKRLRKI